MKLLAKVHKPYLVFGIGLIVWMCLMGLWFWHISKPMVSVVMPVYNGTKNDYLHRSIKSILKQSFTDFELIMVDDGSTDNSWEILKSYAEKDSRIRLLKNDKNRGISYSRNRGNDAARGKYIMLMDQDDDNHPDRMLKQVIFLEQRPWVDIVSTPSVTETPWNFELYDNDAIRFELFGEQAYGHPNVMVKRSFLKKNKIHYNEKYLCANDWDWLIQIRDNGGYFARMYEALFIYNGKGLSKSKVCSREALSINARYSKYLPKKDYRKYLCDVLQMIQKTPKYYRLFTPGYIEETKEDLCFKQDDEK